MIAVNVGALTTTATSLVSVENLEFINHTAGTVIDLNATSGVKTIQLTSPAAGNHTVQGIASGITSIGVSGMSTNGNTATFTFQNAALAGSSDSVTVKIASLSPIAGQNVNVVIDPSSGTNGAETIVIDSSGAPNGSSTTGTVTINDGTSTTLSTVQVTGGTETSLIFTPDTIKTFDASKATGAITAEFATATNQNQTITGGSANDTFNLGTTFDKNDVISGGAGTNTLRFDINNANFALTDTFNVSGIQTLRLSTTALNGTLDVSKFGSDVKTIRLDAALAVDRTISKLANDSTIDLRAATGQTLTAALANTAGTEDKLTVNLRGDHSGGAGATLTWAGITAAGVETVTIDSGFSQTAGADHVGDKNAITTLTAAAMKTLVVKGNTALNVGTLGASVTLVDSTALAPTLTDTTAGNGGLTVTLGTNANVAATVKTGSGNDSITGAAGDETITTGAGVDVVDIGTNGGLDNVDTGSGNDIIIVQAANFGSTSTTYDTIAGGDGTDIIRVGATGTLVDSMFTNVTGVERIDAGAGNYAVNANLGSAAAAAFNNSVRIDQNNTVANQAWNVNASSFSSVQSIDFRGADATALQGDTIVGGAGNDRITGGVNANATGDSMTGGQGADIFFFRTTAEAIGNGLTNAATNSLEMDRITDFSAGVDKIQLNTSANGFGGAITFASNAVVTVTVGANTANRADLAALATATEALFTGSVASTATAVRAYVLTTGAEITTATGLANKTFLIINDDTAAIAATDTWIDITGVVGTLSSGDFLFGNLLA